MKRLSLLGSILSVVSAACGANVTVEDGEGGTGTQPQFPDNEGGFAGTGQPDPPSAAAHACDMIQVNASNCDLDKCIEILTDRFEWADLSGCEEEAVAYTACSVETADNIQCLGRCDDLKDAYDDCVGFYCIDHPVECGLR